MQSLSYVKTDSCISLVNLTAQVEEEESMKKEKIPVFVFGVDRDGIYLKSDNHCVERKIFIGYRYICSLMYVCFFVYLLFCFDILQG